MPPRLAEEPLPLRPPLEALARWLESGGGAAMGLEPLETAALQADVHAYRNGTLAGLSLVLPSPTGETDRLSLLPRGLVRCLAHSPAAWLHQIAAVLATGNRAQLEDGTATRALLAALPAEVVDHLALLVPVAEEQAIAVLCDGPAAESAALRQEWAGRLGPLRPFLTPEPCYDLLRLLREQTLSVNTAAASGDTALLGLTR